VRALFSMVDPSILCGLVIMIGAILILLSILGAADSTVSGLFSASVQNVKTRIRGYLRNNKFAGL